MGFGVERIPVLSDNYIFLLHDPVAHTAAVVDPAEATPVLTVLDQLGAKLTAIFNTHHHGDHVGGNRGLLAQFPEIAVYGGIEDLGRIPGQTIALKDGDQVLFAGETAQVFFIPGHTRGHIAYFFPGHLFCGDTLFGAGCGRLFEGTAQQMFTSLERLRHLPTETKVWCAHEYTLGNLQFALSVDDNNVALQNRYQSAQYLRRHNQPTIPSTIGLEQLTNPFLRVTELALQRSSGETDPVRVFAALRSRKDHF